ncbi:hypothetical protein [Streptomyces sp. NBC_00503]|uniref:hypothetical protein n=1 Tax=Streptomyces sp. NBC_00503 TaxID=2903659 RepID=UPI002E80B45D|nr:hypothetical protein [Streptomyces sp. NBC_00503]WUD85431.1 nuclear pore complex Nup192/Nup205 family protein [Streptomyces sp. NBC_00503]
MTEIAARYEQAVRHLLWVVRELKDEEDSQALIWHSNFLALLEAAESGKGDPEHVLMAIREALESFYRPGRNLSDFHFWRGDHASNLERNRNWKVRMDALWEA